MPTVPEGNPPTEATVAAVRRECEKGAAAGIGSARSGLLDNFGELLRFHLMQLLLACPQLLESFHDSLGHPTVRLLRTADDGELFAGGDALVAVVVVEADAQQRRMQRLASRGFPFFLRSHTVTVAGSAGVSSGFSSTASQMMSANASSCRSRNFLSRLSSRIARKVATSRRSVAPSGNSAENTNDFCVCIRARSHSIWSATVTISSWISPTTSFSASRRRTRLNTFQSSMRSTFFSGRSSRSPSADT